MSSMRRLTLVVLAAVVAVPAARADGDPASDYLYTQQVFVPSDSRVSTRTLGDLARTVAGVTREGYKIRVAVIGSAYDLGAVPALWRKPRTYARFLGAELAFVYKQRLLIVMPNGFGFYWRGQPGTKEYATLSRVSIPAGPDGLVRAAQDAVVQLAAAAGVDAAPTEPPKPTANRDRLIILLAAIAVVVLALLARVLLRRRRA
jgi:hypothetical protein